MTERHQRPHRLHSEGFQSSLLVGQDRRKRILWVCVMYYRCAKASELCNVCCTVSVRVCVCVSVSVCVYCTHGVRASLAPSWFFVGRRTFTSGSGGGHGGTQTDLHTQTDRWIRTSQTWWSVQRSTQRWTQMSATRYQRLCIDSYLYQSNQLSAIVQLSLNLPPNIASFAFLWYISPLNVSRLPPPPLPNATNIFVACVFFSLAFISD